VSGAVIGGTEIFYYANLPAEIKSESSFCYKLNELGGPRCTWPEADESPDIGAIPLCFRFLNFRSS